MSDALNSDSGSRTSIQADREFTFNSEIPLHVVAYFRRIVLPFSPHVVRFVAVVCGRDEHDEEPRDEGG